ncbi:MAG: DUF481 domain-containing protein, partial [Cyanothece sp. SIO1E1]|nr:DUF481 domain-containing protein [Cyanothece sp. SIO1E1]
SFSGLGQAEAVSGAVGSERSLDFQVGAGARFENFEDESSDFNSPTAELGLRYKDSWFGILKVDQFINVGFPVATIADYLLESRTTLSIPITEKWAFENSVRLQLFGEPAPDNPGLLLRFRSGLRYKF